MFDCFIDQSNDIYFQDVFHSTCNEKDIPTEKFSVEKHDEAECYEGFPIGTKIDFGRTGKLFVPTM